MSLKEKIVHPIAFLRSAVADDQMRVRVTHLVVYLLLGTVSLVMSIINFATGYNQVAFVTLGFSAGCLLNTLLLYFDGIWSKIAGFLFCLEITAMFTYFLITGIPGGFSAIWIAMLPSFGLLLFKWKRGILFTALMFAILVFFFYIPFGRSLLQYQYSETFMGRFPILYLAFFCMAAIFEGIRVLTYHELTATRNRYEYLYRHDALTSVLNRYGFREHLDRECRNGAPGSALAVFDIDFFKSINDIYGHLDGDLVLQELVSITLETIGEQGTICRWGGEEFTIFFKDGNAAPYACEGLRQAIECHSFCLDDQQIHLSISIGCVIVPPDKKATPAELFRQADKNLYRAKETGRNRYVQSPYEEPIQEEKHYEE